ncbi:GspE/PulE family protein [Pleionea mediterranea]|uniref:General secretion pathway protein E/type IV pilus assembly protein PilB n=1 Tax=Pleionea mediterranea TaxID=523701 RepID=A0A316FQC7_9GAMM|nr:GspE/PulE family protein [Pleionea mediterranea]PWK49860.1 general secretion pathway protein E/type IV pilus assembly protein PilB [Pleionea mediterranea]
MSEFNTGRKLHPNLLPQFTELEENLDDLDNKATMTLEAETIIRDAYQSKATDIHIDPYTEGFLIRFRIDGMLHDCLQLSTERGQRITNQFKTLCNLNPLPSVKVEEGSFYFDQNEPHLDLRVTAVPCISGVKLAIRVLAPPDAVTSLTQLGLEDSTDIRSWLDATSGMLLVAGPTGSGKTTSLYVLLHLLKISEAHVVTLEEPVEYQIPGINQIQIDEDNGLDFENGTEAMLRLDPDYVLLGELRNQSSAVAAVNVASSGRSLMGTLHSKDAVATISSLRNMGLDDYEIAANLSIVIGQRLVRKLCPECRAEEKPGKQVKLWLDAAGVKTPKKTWTAKGCEACQHIGYKGRTGIFEVWRLTEEDRARIIRNDDEFSIRRSLLDRNQLLMLDDGKNKVEEGITSYEELIRVGALAAAIQNH